MCRILLCACAHGVKSQISLDTGPRFTFQWQLPNNANLFNATAKKTFNSKTQRHKRKWYLFSQTSIYLEDSIKVSWKWSPRNKTQRHKRKWYLFSQTSIYLEDSIKVSWKWSPRNYVSKTKFGRKQVLNIKTKRTPLTHTKGLRSKPSVIASPITSGRQFDDIRWGQHQTNSEKSPFVMNLMASKRCRWLANKSALKDGESDYEQTSTF